MHTLRIATYNIHKGFPFLNRRLAIHELRDRLRALGTDLVFLQEVHGAHARHAARFENWPAAPQYEFLADAVWTDFAYGRNSVYDAGHHGNAILSRFPILAWENEDVSAGGYERRGLLHCELHPPRWSQTLHCVCVHLGLWGRHRGHQIERLRRRIERLVPPAAPLIVAGDFNDWRFRATHQLAHPLDLHEVFELKTGRPARSFPAVLPVMSLDRIYVRGLVVEEAHIHHGRFWSRISDHAVLTATLGLPG
ncbi:MAG: endonuclease/exonuclease/phosphatase family protein [Burkholderiales bacterium]|nr:endonuclease/exonuclease/phosphatase family protein [Burkholderiales bacterium]